MSDNYRALIAELPDFLTWKAGTELPYSACKLHVQWAYHMLKSWSRLTGSGLFEAVLKLPKASQQRLLVAPRISNLFKTKPEPGPEELETLRQYIRMEEYLCQQDGASTAGCWTALGDYYLPPDRAGESSQGDWNDGRVFQAPVFGNLVLDAFSPFDTNRLYLDEFDEVLPHSSIEVALINQRVRRSLDQIWTVSSIARFAVNAMVQVIAVFRVPSLMGATSSLSNRSIIGRMGMVNLHTESWSISKISNAIIHEAIHSLIYKLELVNSLYTDEEKGQTVKAISPWTERPLYLHSFVHACFVWFGLWCFWNLCPPGDEDVNMLRERARHGFSAGSPLSGISTEAYEGIQPDVRLAIERMSCYVLNNAS
jgi:hypothetical protein